MKFNFTDNKIKLNHDTCIVTGIFEESIFFAYTKNLDIISQGYIQKLIDQKILNKKFGQIIPLYNIPNLPSKQILLINCGSQEKFDAHHYRKIILKIIQYKENICTPNILIALSELNIQGYDDYWKIRHTIEIINHALYNFHQFKNTDYTISTKNFNKITIYIPHIDPLKNYTHAINDGLSISKGIKIAKNLGNMPPNICNPDYMVNQVKKLKDKNKNVQIEILNELEIKKLGMNAYLSVGQGSCYPAQMPIIKYQGNDKNNNDNTQPIVLIGKGLTFDSGGISIKDAHKMDEMKYDMCGAAVVYAVMCTAIELNLPLNIIGILAISENMISSTSLKPGDILSTLSGKTVEVLNTDAEGRLILCDVLTYVERYSPQIVIDIATLTGACVIALGNQFSGLMSNNEQLANELILASKQSRDYIWQLPLHKTFHKQLESKCADIANVGGRSGGAITAGCFLQKFAHKYSWAHLDIAGTAWISNDQTKSATGRPVTLLTQFLINRTIQQKNKK